MSSRKQEFALVLCLLLLTSIIALETESLVPPLFSLRVSAGVASHVGGFGSSDLQKATGQILVRVFVNSSTSGSPPNVGPDANGVSFSVVANGTGPFTPNVYHTNSTGEVHLTLNAADYSVLFFDLPMNLTVHAPVQKGSITELNLTITSNTYPTTYFNLPSDQATVAPSRSQGTMEVGSPFSLFGPTMAFLSVTYRPGVGTVRQVEAPVLITGLGVRSSGPSQVSEWIGFITLTQVSMAGVSSVGLSVFGADSSVVVHPLDT